MFQAVRSNDEEMCLGALAAGADLEGLDPANGTQTALMQAAQLGHTRVLRVLLGAGASADRSIGQCSALNYAAMSGSDEAARLLINGGADVNLAPPVVDPPALSEAAGAGAANVVRVLLGAGANPTALDSAGQTALQVAKTAAVRRMLRNVITG